jgi:hypothetical protein
VRVLHLSKPARQSKEKNPHPSLLPVYMEKGTRAEDRLIQELLPQSRHPARIISPNKTQSSYCQPIPAKVKLLPEASVHHVLFRLHRTEIFVAYQAARMIKETYSFPPMPEIGHPESHYSKLVHRADQEGNVFAHEAAKVGQYITLALDSHLPWPAKLRYFQHALKRHCVAPAIPDEPVWLFYQELANLVRRYAGQEALKLASAEDDMYATRVGLGGENAREAVESDAESFFAPLVPTSNHCPEWFNEEDFFQLKLIRDQWI